MDPQHFFKLKLYYLLHVIYYMDYVILWTIWWTVTDHQWWADHSLRITALKFRENSLFIVQILCWSMSNICYLNYWFLVSQAVVNFQRHFCMAWHLFNIPYICVCLSCWVVFSLVCCAAYASRGPMYLTIQATTEDNSFLAKIFYTWWWPYWSKHVMMDFSTFKVNKFYRT
jgi:hypothetical protein